MIKKVYIENGNKEYSSLFSKLGFAITHDFNQANLICFTGGADVTPDMYQDKAHHTTYNDVFRDEKEKRLFKEALKKNIPMVGICRGGQFLNVMSGGRMYQNVSNHVCPHDIVDIVTGETVYVSSTHHQMMMPSYEGHILATSTNVTSNREWFTHEISERDISDEGIEVVYYPHTNCLCFQPHPEFDCPEYEGMRRYFLSLLNNYLEV